MCIRDSSWSGWTRSPETREAMAAFLIRYTDLGRLRAGLAPTGAARTCPSVTRRAAASGSVSPMPKDGHWPATGQAPQAGVREWQVRRPWMITRCENIVHSRFSIMAHSSASTACLLYTSDAADDLTRVDLGG